MSTEQDRRPPNRLKREVELKAAAAAESANRRPTECRADTARVAAKLFEEHPRLAGKVGRLGSGSQVGGDGL